MTPTYLSLLTILLTILKCHGMIPELEWLIVFAPAIIDFIISFIKREKLKRATDAFMTFLSSNENSDLEDR
jgi:hypothetical protein